MAAYRAAKTKESALTEALLGAAAAGEKESVSDADELIEFADANSYMSSYALRSRKEGKHSESQDFTATESMMWRQHHIKRFLSDETVFWNQRRRSQVTRLMYVVSCGIVIAVLGITAELFTEFLTEQKLHRTLHFVEEGHWVHAITLYVGVSCSYALLASFCCWWQPYAAGSGIPEVKAYLNGIKIDQLLRFATLFPKWLGMSLVCSSGLPLGKEGPMVHIGAIVGAAMSQGKSILFGTDVSWTKAQELRSDVSKRDFITFGAAAGIAAAFRAPIGGILFTLEEGASFWSTNLIFQAFLCATVTLLATSLFFSGREIGEGMIAFGDFPNLEDGHTNFHTSEVFIFIAMGAAGGLIGAFFVNGHRYIQGLRKRYGITKLGSRKWQVAEVLILALIFSIVSFCACELWFHCTPMPTSTSTWTKEERELLDDLVQWRCADGEYNEVASLFMVTPAVALQQLFHYREYDGSSYETFSTGALETFGLLYFGFAVITCGLFVPVGLFVPSLLSGAAFGRIIGHILNVAAPAGTVADSGTYALMGAAAILGGIGRMTIAGTVIMLEACGNTTYLLPIMVTFGAARYSGNALTPSIYEEMIELKELPFLEGQPPPLGLVDYQPIADYMAVDVITLNAVEKVGRIHDVLATTSHNGFPVVTTTGHLCGFILRKHLTTLLLLRAFSYPMSTGEGGIRGSIQVRDGLVQLKPTNPVFWDTMEKEYPNYPDIENITIETEDRSLWVDCRPYMDVSPYSVSEKASVLKSYKLFRTMGLRHLVVVDDDHKVVGILTRHDITEANLKKTGVSHQTRAFEFSVLEELPPAYVDRHSNTTVGRVKREM